MTPKFLVYDTETTGLFQFKDKVTGEPIPADAPGQPRMASFSYVLADEAGKAISTGRYFVQPDGWTIDGTYAAEVNGLTDAYLHEHGQPVADILDVWNGFIDQGLIAVAFNSQFDQKMMRAELRRANRPDRFEDTKAICVMRGLLPYYHDGLDISRGFVKLSVACEYFGITNDNPHDASADAEAARAILERLIADDRLPDAKVHYAKKAVA